jgi:hypothetical protein
MPASMHLIRAVKMRVYFTAASSAFHALRTRIVRLFEVAPLCLLVVVNDRLVYFRRLSHPAFHNASYPTIQLREVILTRSGESNG